MLDKIGTFLRSPYALVPLFLILAFLSARVFIFVIFRLIKRSKVKNIRAEELLELFKKPVFFTILILALIYGASFLNVPAKYWKYILKGAETLLVILWTYTILKVIKRLSEKELKWFIEKGHLGTDIAFLIKNLSYTLVVVISVLTLMSLWNVNLSPFLASAGIAGIALALAARESLANFFGGISIFLDKSYKVGDYIILDSGERGEVVDIGIRSTRIKTRDDVMITIPNSIMANSKIINESAPEPRFRLRIPIGVSYGSDLDKVEEILLSLVSTIPHVVKSPEPRIRYREFGDSSINLELLCWVDHPENKGPVTHHLIKLIHKRFREEGIVIPFPQRDVHIYDEKKL